MTTVCGARRHGAWAVVLVLLAGVLTIAQEADRRMSLDVKDTDIRDAIRMISKAYDLSIVLDNDVSGKVTLHLSDVPTMQGLRTLADASGLEVTTEGSVYRIRKKADEEHSSIRFSRGKLTIDVDNADVVPFLQELSSKTAVSIVPDGKVSGKITGKLFDVPLDDGIRALLEGNGFTVIRRRNIYQVSTKDDSDAQGVRGRRASTRLPGDFFVDYTNDMLTIEVSNGNLEDVIKAITEQTDVQVVTYGSIKAEVNAKLFDKSLTEAFALLLGGTQYTFVEKDGIILIGDRNAATPSGQALSKSELIPLKHIKADEVLQVLPKNISANNVKVIKEQNALLVSGTSEDIVMTREFLAAIDIPTPQVRIDAVIVEYSERIGRSFGMRVWRKNPGFADQSLTVPGPAIGGQAASDATQIGLSTQGLRDLLGISGGLLGRLPSEFYIALRWLENQGKAKVLAQPSITTLNGRKAKIDVDQTQYFKVTSGDSTQSQYYSARIQPIKFGISLDITPWISQGGQITAEITPVVSNAEGSGAESYPNVSSRSLSTTIRLNDGETIALGGLIKHEENTSSDKIPILGDLPFIGALFRTNSRTRAKSNLVIYITPHVLTRNDTVNIKAELRDYDLYLLNNLERKPIAGLRGMRERRKQQREAEEQLLQQADEPGGAQPVPAAIVPERVNTAGETPERRVNFRRRSSESKPDSGSEQP
jgi:type IV pilus assembly protein PilQ